MTDEVVVSFNEANAHFKYGEMDLVCRLIEGKYPNYEAVIPKENPNCMTIDQEGLPAQHSQGVHLRQQDDAPGAALHWPEAA